MTSASTENAFMADLFADLDASIFSEGLSPLRTKASSSQSSLQAKRHYCESNQSSSYRAKSKQRSPSLVKLSQSPSPRKRAIKRVKRDGEGCSTSTSSQIKRATREREEEIRAATEAFANCTDDWTCDLNEVPPKESQARKLQRVIEKESRLQAELGEKEQDDSIEERYTRCLVKEVVLDRYIPRKYLDSHSGRHSTKGVLPTTVTSAMQRRQKVLYVCELEKIDLSTIENRRNGKHKEGARRKVVLRDEWYSTAVCEGDVIHLIGAWEEEDDHIKCKREKHIVVDLEDPDEALWNEMEDMPNLSQDKPTSRIPTMTLASTSQQGDADGRKAGEVDNLLILHPDVLLSATAISTVVRCTRKAYLQNKVKASGPASEDSPSESLLMGKMLHEVLQSCLTGRPKDICGDVAKISEMEAHTPLDGPFPAIWRGPKPTDFSHRFVKEQIQSQVQGSLEDILCAGLDTHTAMDQLWEAAFPFGQFATRYLVGDERGYPKKEAEGQDKRSKLAPLVLVKRVLDVEEDIWSPMYGLKGFIDVSVEVELLEKDNVTDTPRGTNRTLLMPLELKTGRSIDIIQHQAQTLLYNLMMSDRYKQKVDIGLLYYSKSSTLHLVRSVRNEVRALLISRNELANHLHRKSEDEKIRGMLPPTIDRERDCSRCYVSSECMLYKRTIEKASVDEESPIASIYEAKVMHLTQRHADFFKHWERLLSLEEDDIVRYRRELWTMTAAARESTGRCLAKMTLFKDPLEQPDSKEKSRTLSGMNDRVVFQFCRSDQNLLQLVGGFSIGDPISVSIEPDMFSVAQGHVLNLAPHLITLTLDRDLMALVKRCKDRNPIFRIDKEEFASGMAKVRYNLAKLFYNAPHGDIRRRDLIVDLHKPQFIDVERNKVDFTNKDINDDQKKAIKKVLSAQDYALIVGMPGTGKTTTIVELIKHLVARGNSILLTSYTHSAVDTICRKLVKEDAIKLLRLGKIDRVHSDIHPYMFKEASSVENLQDQLMQPNVVATTCLSISHALFAKRKFDYCIVDEASQITLPTCLGPLRFADKFVLVGDPLQLPPLVKDASAKEGGLDVSLFDLLQQAHPHSVVQLRVQYRMNQDIMKLSNELIYQGQLQCGSKEVQNSSLDLPNLPAARQRIHAPPLDACQMMSTCWIEKIFDTNTRALFIDTDLIPGGEVRVGETLLENRIEAEIVTQISAAFICAGVPPKEIAIITPYRQQLRALVKRLGSVAAGDDKIEVLTADKSQGRDKDVVLISLVRSNNNNVNNQGNDNGKTEDVGIGQLLNDVKRINVALTRAKKKLIIVGSRKTLSRSDLLRRLWDLMHSNGWTMNLSEDYLRQHQGNLGRVWADAQVVSPTKTPKRINKSQAIFRNRPVLRDVFNEVA